LFLVSADFLCELIPNKQFLEKQSILVEKDKEIQIDELIKTLNNLGFVYSEFNKNGSYRKS
jgi:hypothetical protein